MDNTFDFIVYAYPRTGNTYLGYILSQHPKILCIPELFGGHYHRKELPSFESTIKHIKDHIFTTKNIKLGHSNNIVEEILNHKKDLIMGTTVISSNIRYTEPKSINYLNEINKNKNIKKIILTRDPLQTYISAKIAKKSTYWVCTDTTNVKINFNLSEFQKHCKTVDRYYYSILESIKNQVFLVINYDTYTSNIKTIFDFLGVENIEIDVNNTITRKQNSSNLFDQVLNYKQMKEDLRSIRPVDPYFVFEDYYE